jgi:hypothetical protein
MGVQDDIDRIVGFDLGKDREQIGGVLGGEAGIALMDQCQHGVTAPRPDGLQAALELQPIIVDADALGAGGSQELHRSVAGKAQVCCGHVRSLGPSAYRRWQEA